MDNFSLDQLANRIARTAISLDGTRAALIALSGIDGCGKGYVASRLADELERRNLRTAVINIDGWLNLPPIRFRESSPAEHFYDNAIRFDQMFEQLVLPLKAKRSIRVEADFTEETAQSYRRHVYSYEDIDAIVLEGIYLLKRPFLRFYDLAVWVDCTFETALERALARRQEGLSAEETIQAYESIYFPAQRIHFFRDHPRESASAILPNDPRITPPRANALGIKQQLAEIYEQGAD